ncbi:hypothetical protein C8R45DRAFT_941158 [Mycena sanguinolenta]|nr:hypothetical protein C8R45DRAFT_941158 [Mycena sanguinolenta]
MSLSVTATTPFLPSNSNADISDTVKETSSSGQTSTSTATSIHTPAQTSPTPAHRNSPQTAAIAGSVVAVIVVLTLALVLVRLRRRKLRIRQRRIPKQFLDSQEHIVPKSPPKKGTVPAGAESAEAEINQSNSVGEAVLAEAQLKHSETVAPGAAPEGLPLTESVAVGAEESAPAQSDPQEAAREEQTMTLRMRRLEAQDSGSCRNISLKPVIRDAAKENLLEAGNSEMRI